MGSLNRDFVAGLLAIAIGLYFSLQALRFGMGTLEDIGPGGFPVVVGGIVVLLGVAMTVRSFATERVPLVFNLRAVVAINAGIVLFVVLTAWWGLVPGTIALVFCASLARSPFSFRDSAAITGGLIVIAFAMLHFFNINLPLF